MLCPPDQGELERRAALTLVLRCLVCLRLEDLGQGSGAITPDSFDRTRRRFGGALFTEGPSDRLLASSSREELARLESILRAAGSSAELNIGRLYEEVLEVRPGLDRGRRKASGSYYTPRELAATTVARGLGPCLRAETGEGISTERILGLKVCDPAMGAGGFLLPALDYLADALGTAMRAHGEEPDSTECRALVAENCLYGVDLDPIAVQLTGMLIWLRVGDFSRPMDAFSMRLVQGDALLGSVADSQGSASRTPLGLLSSGLHWAECFPEVFAGDHAGFDAVIGNPPWETNKPSSREFFARHDKDFPRLSKQAAITRQKELCRDPALSAEWQRCLLEQKARSQHCRENYRHQGVADLNAYKLFLERGFDLLRDGGRLAMLVPAAVYSDRGSQDLRELFLNHSRWDWLFAFENRQRIFPIDSRFKFCALILAKGGRTGSIRCAFMKRSLADWNSAEKNSFSYTREDLDAFSPKHRVLVEFTSSEDKTVLAKIHAGGQALGDTGASSWDLQYGREFDTTLDSKLFPPRPDWEHRGYRAASCGRWLQGPWQQLEEAECREGLVISCDGRHGLDPETIEAAALPLFEGRMIAAFSSRAKAWVSGRGRSARWDTLGPDEQPLGPQYLMGLGDYQRASKSCPGPRVAFMRIASATNERSMIATYLAGVPMADSLFYLRSGRGSLSDCLATTSILNSFCFDFQVRRRLGGLNMSQFLLAETVLPQWQSSLRFIPLLAAVCAQLVLHEPMFAAERKQLSAGGLQVDGPRLSQDDRIELRSSLEALIANLYGLNSDDFAWILRDCAHSTDDLRKLGFQRQLDPKGFWRVDRLLPAENRLTNRSLSRLRELEDLGLQCFLEQRLNSGAGVRAHE